MFFRVFYIAYVSNKWVYGMLEAMDNLFRGLFVLFQLSTLILAYKVGHALNNMLWRSKEPSEKKITKKGNAKNKPVLKKID